MSIPKVYFFVPRLKRFRVKKTQIYPIIEPISRTLRKGFNFIESGYGALVPVKSEYNVVFENCYVRGVDIVAVGQGVYIIASVLLVLGNCLFAWQTEMKERAKTLTKLL